MTLIHLSFFFFFFNDTATTEIYTLSLHDALPILKELSGIPYEVYPVYRFSSNGEEGRHTETVKSTGLIGDRKSTRLNSSHGYISYAVFCLKKKKKKQLNLARMQHIN